MGVGGIGAWGDVTVLVLALVRLTPNEKVFALKNPYFFFKEMFEPVKARGNVGVNVGACTLVLTCSTFWTSSCNFAKKTFHTSSSVLIKFSNLCVFACFYWALFWWKKRGLYVQKCKINYCSQVDARYHVCEWICGRSASLFCYSVMTFDRGSCWERFGGWIFIQVETSECQLKMKKKN